MFPPGLIDAAKGAFADAPDDWPRVIGLDPAATGTAALVVVAYERESRQMRIVDCEKRLNPRHDGLFEMLQTHIFRHKPETVVIEAQGGSHFFSDVPQVRTFIYDEVHSSRPLIEFKTTGDKKHDERFGVPLIAELMAKERLRIAWAPEKAAAMKPLISDMTAYQPVFHGRRRYDTVLALWFAVKTIHEDFKQGARRNGASVQRAAANRPFLLQRRLRRVV